MPEPTSSESDGPDAACIRGNESGSPCRVAGAVQVIDLTAESDLCDILPTVVVTKHLIFINGARVSPDQISDKVGRDIESEPTPLPDMQEPEWIENVTENGLISIKYPFRPHNCAACWESFISPKSLLNHMEAKHKEGFLRFICERCNRSFPKLQSMAIHYGKCIKGQIGRTNGRGPTAPRRVDTPDTHNRFEGLAQETQPAADADTQNFPCEACSATFRSKIGLGQHIRHRHPDWANEKRIAAVAADIERKREARTKEAKANPSSKRGAASKGKSLVWSDEDDLTLRALCIKYHGERYINKLIEKELPGKTNKQISDRRRTLKLIGEKGDKSVRDAHVQSKETPTTVESATKQTKGDTNTYPVNRSQFRAAIQKAGSPALVGASAEVLYRATEGEEYIEQELEVMRTLALRCKKAPRGGENKRSSQGRKKPVGRRAKEKARSFRTHQFLFENDRKALASKLFSGKEEEAKCDLEPEVVEKTYTERFGGDSQVVDLSEYPPAEQVNNEKLMEPISPAEVKRALGKAKKDTAAGPDLIDLKNLKANDHQGHALSNIFNTWLLTGKVPESVKENRSILLPKGSTDLDNINNWRPLTISSVVLRLYTNIIASRVLAAFKINERQRGFIKASGCAENGFLIEKVIEHAKKNRNPLCVAFLDLAKAFDTVSHKHITAGLQRFGACESFIEIIEDLYKGASTSFTTAKGKTGLIQITRGVKQGDPLSPLLFNIAMDPLLAEITNRSNGYKFGPASDDRIESLAYADDNSLLTGTPEEMNTNLEIVNSFCDNTGMRLNVKKSAAFCLTPKGSRSYLVNQFTTPLRVGGEEVPLIKPSESTKYLGSKISAWVNKVAQDVETKLEGMIKAIDGANQKPRQKLEMLESYALPKVAFPLRQEHNPQCKLLKLDRLVRSYVKKWLHLPDSTCNAIFHSSKADGGLGLPEFTKSVPAQRINNLRALKNSSDQKIRRMAHVMRIDELIDKYAKSANLVVPSSSKGKTKWQHLPLQEWGRLSVAGQGVKDFQNKRSNSWATSNATYFGEADFITAMQLRSNTFPCRATMSRAGRPSDALCRRCHSTVETVGHISGHCLSVKNYRIKRHNVITQTVAEKTKQQGWLVSNEPRIRDSSNQVWKPDLVLVRDRKAVVIDPTIVYEAGHSLAQANKAKVDKYSPLSELIKTNYNVDEVTVRGLAIGCRGGWHHDNTKTLKELGIDDPGFEAHLCRLALKGTINLVRLFCDQ